MSTQKRTLTPVFDGAKDLPVRVGWYLCWHKYYGLQTKDRMRRYWNGRFFSVNVDVGVDDWSAKERQRMKSAYPNHELYWCGLTAPYES